MKGIYVFLAQGYEPLEALAPLDILHRAQLDAHFVALDGERFVQSAQGYCIEADMTWDEFISEEKDSFADGRGAMVFPGGLPGADNLGGSKALTDILVSHFEAGGLTCAICAAPARVLARGLGSRLQGRRMTVYAGFENEIQPAGAVCTGESVTVDGNLITAKGPGLAIDFGLAILKAVADPRVYNVVKHAMML